MIERRHITAQKVREFRSTPQIQYCIIKIHIHELEELNWKAAKVRQDNILMSSFSFQDK